MAELVGDCECVVLGDVEGLGDCVCLPSGQRKGMAVAVVDRKGSKKVVLGGLDLEGLREALQGRGNIVMTRVRDEDLRKIDTLVNAGLFDSRSEATAFLIQEGIKTQAGLFDRVEETAAKIRELREKMRREVAG